jgi:hypothetical protein
VIVAIAVVRGMIAAAVGAVAAIVAVVAVTKVARTGAVRPTFQTS